MANNAEHNDKILKTFSNIRCLNRDQLPRYLDGRLTDVEKHLVEQHLVDCDLCYDALQVLQKPQYRDKYQTLSVNIQQYIRNSIKQVSHVQKAERYQRKEKKKESLLIYFWVVAAIAIAAGGIYLIQQENKFKTLTPKPLASADDVTAIQVAGRKNVEQPVSAPPASRPDTAVGQAGIITPPPAPVVAKPVVKKDTANAVAPAAPKPVVKPDTVAKKPAAAVKPPEPAPAPVQKDSPAPVVKEKKEEPKVVVKEKEKEKEKEKPKDEDDKKPVAKPAATPAGSTDEFLYKAAMVYHQQGDLNEAITRYKHLAASNSRYGELARYQLAVCYRSKGQTGKAKRMFKEVVSMGGSMKDKAQAALDNL